MSVTHDQPPEYSVPSSVLTVKPPLVAWSSNYIIRRWAGTEKGIFAAACCLNQCRGETAASWPGWLLFVCCTSHWRHTSFTSQPCTHFSWAKQRLCSWWDGGWKCRGKVDSPRSFCRKGCTNKMQSSHGKWSLCSKGQASIIFCAKRYCPLDFIPFQIICCCTQINIFYCCP